VSNAAPTDVRNTRFVAAVLALLLGGLGLHKFYLGKTTAGAIMLIASLLSCGIGFFIMHPIGLIEGVIYLLVSDQDFYDRYVAGDREWF
jgi:TM2 domain-containing membrane protein YozV